MEIHAGKVEFSCRLVRSVNAGQNSPHWRRYNLEWPPVRTDPWSSGMPGEENV